MLTWTPQGRLFPPTAGDLPDWLGGYGALPFAVPLGDHRCPVFFSGRDRENRSQVGACTLDLARLSVVDGSLTPEPLVRSGPPGAFDDSGCSMSCIVRHTGAWYLYYSGWTLGGTVPFHLAIGLAVSQDDGRTFRKLSLAPVLGRHEADPFLCASPSILIEGGVWRMWYVSAVRWEKQAGGWRHYYLIKYAESHNGIEWRRDGRIAIGFKSADEYAIGRPHVLKDGGIYRMWYCSRGDRYRIGYAESRDGLTWERRDESAGIAPPAEGWDSEMQAYPMVFRDGRHLVMLYNGNGYGATGFGCATAEAGE
ncbi:MAG TPA: hypothetical protein VF179_14210 [Thermoanaerobaculia bacterium]|nr:hypothetical protein [Thermoanaerobaculia bacterium]